MDKQKNEKLLMYSKECTLLGMLSIPYIGVYSYSYKFINHKISFHLPQNPISKKEIRETFPQRLVNTLEDLSKKNIPIEYLLSTYDGTFFYEEFVKSHSNQMLRINIVCHPYIFYDLKNLKRDHNTYAYICIFKNHFNDPIYETNEDSGLRIDVDRIINNINKKEVILHKSNDSCPALSPNNCALLIDLNSLFIEFYLVCVVVYNDMPVKALVQKYKKLKIVLK